MGRPENEPDLAGSAGSFRCPERPREIGAIELHAVCNQLSLLSPQGMPVW